MIDRYKLLAEYLAERADAPFVWGVNDCCIFAADWVFRLTGRDPMEWARKQYDDETSAAIALERGGGIARLVHEALHRPALPTVATAQRGDVVLFESGSGAALGICVGDKFAAVKPGGGVGYFAMRHAFTAWRID